MKPKSFILKGDICFSIDKDTLVTYENHFLVCTDGVSAGVFKALPQKYSAFEVLDYSGMLIIPGLTDLHIHAPQYTFRGLGMDDELLDWLNNHAFPEEGRYSDTAYALEAYLSFAEAMEASATTRACIFATVHVPATLILMDLMEKTGLRTFVGKVNMDRNAPDYLVEKSSAQSADDTVTWLETCAGRYENVSPIVTPRFIPTCTDDLMRKLHGIQQKYALPVQSHLSENPAEIELVGQLCSDAEFYGDAYDRFGLFGKDAPTIMAHCVYSGDREILRMKENGVYIAHCPQSNTNIASGIAPVRKFLDMDVRCGLGSDVAGGTTESIFRAMTDAVQMSKIRWRLQDSTLRPLTFEEAFYLGTKGGGAFFGKVGSFETGYEFDAVVIDDAPPKHFRGITLRERLEKLAYISNGREVAHKFVSGKQLF